MEWTWSDPRIWAAFCVVSQFVLCAIFWLARKEFASTGNLLAVNKVLQDQIDELKDRIKDAHHRADMHDKDLKSLPTYDVTNQLGKEMSGLTASMAELKAEIRNIDNRTESTDNAVTRIEQHLLSKAA